MKRLEHKIKWTLVSKFLKVTESTSQQLLDWLEWGFKNVDEGSFICHNKLYLDKYYIDDSSIPFCNEDFSFEDGHNRINIYVPILITGRGDDDDKMYVAEIWNMLYNNKEFRKEMIDKFKKYYKLK